MGELKHDYYEEKRILSRLEESTYTLNQAAAQLDNAIEGLNACWKDGNSTELRRRMTESESQLEEFIRTLNSIKSNIEKKSKIFYDAELEAERLAKMREVDQC